MCRGRPLRVAGQRALTHMRAGVDCWSHAACALAQHLVQLFKPVPLVKRPIISQRHSLLSPLVASLVPLTTKYCLFLVIFVLNEIKTFESNCLNTFQNNSLYIIHSHFQTSSFNYLQQLCITFINIRKSLTGISRLVSKSIPNRLKFSLRGSALKL